MTEREVLATWLEDVPVLALKAFAEDMPGAHSARKSDVIAFILNDRDARARALESMAVEQAVRRA